MILEANCSNIILFCYGTILMFECYVRGFGKCLVVRVLLKKNFFCIMFDSCFNVERAIGAG